MIDPFARALQEKMAGYREEMLFHFKELLKMDTVRGEPCDGAPFGPGPRRALEYVLALSEGFGLKTVNLDNYIGYSEYGPGEDYVCSIAHLDVVPPGDGWTHPPFGAEEENGILYARGAGDDKPGVVVGLYTLRCMKELGYVPRRKLRVIYGCAEETGMEDLDHYLEQEPLPLFGFTPDADGYNIVNAEKGRMEFRLEGQKPADCPVLDVTGGLAPNMVPASVTAVFDRSRMTPEEGARFAAKLRTSPDLTWEDRGDQTTVAFRGASAHAAMPENGRSAISLYAQFAGDALGERADGLTRFIADAIGLDWTVPKLDIACRDDYMGPLTLSLGLIQTQGDRVWTVGDIRYPTSTSARELQAKLEAAASAAGLRLQVLSTVDGHHCVREEEFAVLREVCLDKGKPEPRCVAIAGGTYAKKFGGRLVAFGGCGDGVHAPDEFVPIQDFYDHADMVSYTLYRLSGRA